MMTPEFWASLVEKSAVVALAIFAILMLQREYKRQIEERDDRLAAERENHRDERAELVGVIERNTEGWQRATQTMGEIATGMAMLVTTFESSRKDIANIRVLLARRPCVADEVIEDDGS